MIMPVSPLSLSRLANVKGQINSKIDLKLEKMSTDISANLTAGNPPFEGLDPKTGLRAITDTIIEEIFTLLLENLKVEAGIPVVASETSEDGQLKIV